MAEGLSLNEIENICMKMISYTGEGRAFVYEAIESFQAGDYELCGKKIEEAEEFLTKAHKIQFKGLMTPQAKGVEIPFNILVIHAMDLLMISTAEKDVIKKMLEGAKGRNEK